jgi:hypothetical protein
MIKFYKYKKLNTGNSQGYWNSLKLLYKYIISNKLYDNKYGVGKKASYRKEQIMHLIKHKWSYNNDIKAEEKQK